GSRARRSVVYPGAGFWYCASGRVFLFPRLTKPDYAPGGVEGQTPRPYHRVRGHCGGPTVSAPLKKLLLPLCLLAGCRTSRIESLKAEYETADRLLNQGNSKQALALADSALRRCGSSQEWCWRLRILKAETLIANRQAEAAL